MNGRLILKSLSLIGIGLPCFLCTVHTASGEISFRRHAINANSQFSACAAVDVNRDGQLDIFCGGFWYESPHWKRHRVRDVVMIRGRFDDYSNLALDVNGDGRKDIISVNYRSKSLYWVENPGVESGDWKTHVIDTPGPSETGRLADIDNDGRLDVLPNGTKFAAWFQIDPTSVLPKQSFAPKWLRHELPTELIGHGIGFGDVNSDGRSDLVAPNGWLQAPEDRVRDRWTWHADFSLHRDASVPILVHDVDGDGDSDLIWGRGHNVGLYWMEQTRDEWRLHAIDTSWSGAHSIMLADINGDGIKDLVAAKRYLGHDGKDPGEFDPLVVYWYSFNRDSHCWHRHLISFGETCGFDLDPKCVDLDGDGDIDILAPTRGGLYYLENLGKADSQNVRSSALPRSIDRNAWFPPTGLGESNTDSRFAWGVKRWQILRAMERVMGPLPGPDRRVALDMRLIDSEETSDYVRHRIEYTSESGDQVPAFLLVPNVLLKSPNKIAAAVLCLHPTSPLGKSQICGLGGQPSRFYAHELATRGLVCIAPDYPSFGDYRDYDFSDDAYVSGTMKAIWNNVRAIDLLETLPYVDRDQIGCIGHSLGGHNGLFTAAFDQRIRAVVTSCGFNSFEHYFEGDLNGWASDRYMPRIRSEFSLKPERVPFDFDAVLSALSPRPVFVSAPIHDANFEVEGVRKSVASAEKVYAFHQSSDELKVVYPDAAHDFPDSIRQQSYKWLEQKLNQQ